MNAYKARREKLAASLAQRGIAMAVIEDTEGRRDPSIRYLSGHPSDALLFITSDARSLLVPWGREHGRENGQRRPNRALHRLWPQPI